MSPINLTITAETPEELKNKVLALAATYWNHTYTAPVSEPAEMKAQSPKRGRPAKIKAEVEEDSAVVTLEAEEEVPTKEVEEVKVTKEDMLAALKAYHQANGPDKTKALVATLGASRPSDIKESDYKKIVDLCNE